MQVWGRVIDTLSVQIPQPHNTNPQKERRERENSRRRRRSKQLMPMIALALILKRSCLTPLNTGSERLFNRDTERGIKVLWTVVLQGSAVSSCISILMYDQTGTYGTDQSSIKSVHRVTYTVPKILPHITTTHIMIYAEQTLKGKFACLGIHIQNYIWSIIREQMQNA